MRQDIDTDHYCIHHWSWTCTRISRLLLFFQSVWYQANHCFTIEFHIWTFRCIWSHNNDDCNQSYWYSHRHIAITIWRSLLINWWMWMCLSNKLRVYLFEDKLYGIYGFIFGAMPISLVVLKHEHCDDCNLFLTDNLIWYSGVPVVWSYICAWKKKNHIQDSFVLFLQEQKHVTKVNLQRKQYFYRKLM